MGEVGVSVVVAICVVLVISIGWKALSWVWFKPKKIEKYLRDQGLEGHSYRFLHGEIKSFNDSYEEARSKPMELCHQIQSRAMPFLHQSVEKYGKIFFTWFGPIPWFVTMDPNMIRDVFNEKLDSIGKIPSFPYDLLIGGGVADYEGEKWVKHRRIINPAFHMEKLKMMVPNLYTCCIDMVNKWHALVHEESFELDVWPPLNELSADIISRTGFGTTYDEGLRIFQLHNEQTHHLIEAYQCLYIRGFEYLPTKRNNRMYAINREVGTILRNIINKRETAMKAGQAPMHDLLSVLMQSNMKEIENNENSKKFGMTRDEVIEECRVFYFAGQEMTSTLLVWVMIVLSMHRDWQVKAREEIFQVFGKRIPDFEGINQLKTVNMILHEVLRLYSPPSFLMRATRKTVQVGKFTLPPGVHIVMPALLVQHDPELWGEDVEEFKPERFSVGVSKASKNSFSFFPFGMGPRICIGQNFVLLNAKVSLTAILRHFTFELAPNYVHAPFYGAITLQPQHGAQLIFHKI